MSKRVGPLAEPEFRRLYLARAFSLFGDGLVPVALAFAVLDINRSPSALGVVLAGRSLALVACLLVAGVVADRLPRRGVLIGSDLLRLVAQGVSAALLITGRAELWELFCLALVYGVGWAFFLPTSTGFVPQTVSPGLLQQANALLASTTSAFTILGPVAAGVLVATVGPGWALAVDASTFLVSAVFVFRIRVEDGPAPARASFLSDLREGLREFGSRTWLWVDAVYSALGNLFVLSPLWVLGPVIAKRSLGGAPAWAAIVTAFGLGSVLGGLALLRLRPARPLLAGVPLLALLALPVALLAVPVPTAAVAAGALAAGFGLSVFNTLFETTVQQHVPPAALSRVASIDWVMSTGLQPIGFALVGPIAVAVGVRAPLLAAAAWIVVSTAVVLMIPSVRQVRGPREPGGPVEAVPSLEGAPLVGASPPPAGGSPA